MSRAPTLEEPGVRPVRRLVLLVYGMIAVTMAMWVAVLPLIPAYADDLGLSDAAAGALITSASVTAVALSLPIGLLTDRLGARLLTIAAGVFLVVSSLAQAFATEFWTLMAARAVAGIAYAAVWTAGPAWIDAATSEWRRSSALSGMMVVTGIGLTVGSALAGVLTEELGQEVPFVAFAAAGLAVTIALARMPGAGDAEGVHASVGATLAAVRRDRLTLIATGSTLAAGLAIGVANLLVPLELADNGYGTGSLGLVLAASSALSVFASVAVTAAGDRAISPMLVGLLLVASGALFAVPTLTVAAAPLVAFLILRGPLNSGLITVAYPIAAAGARAAHVGAGAVMGLLSLAWGLASMVSPLAAGAVSDAVGPAAVHAALAIGLVGLGAWTMTVRADARTADERGDRQVKAGEALTSFYERFVEADIEGMVELFRPDGVLAVNHRRHVGQAQIRRSQAVYREGVTNCEVVFKVVGEAGESALGEAVFRADRVSGGSIHLPFAAVVDMEDGRILRLAEYFEKAEPA
jgi:predicted MFS family arabinose efflux permease/ketosteroid isomerase-like protein